MTLSGDEITYWGGVTPSFTWTLGVQGEAGNYLVGTDEEDSFLIGAD